MNRHLYLVVARGVGRLVIETYSLGQWVKLYPDSECVLVTVG